ncbi:Protein EFR3 B [Chytriomyces hyalinus]|nr:Protein EFR3 B [Chytriomyces hyalinus]
MACCGQSGINPRGLLTPNHVALVNKVYPSDAGETGPRSAALSSLLFYADSKPIKLAKVGECLARRTDTDLARGREGHVKVTLIIIDALLSQCPPAHINIMAKSVLRVIDSVTASPNADLMLDATSTFVTFNNLYTHDTIIDVELTALYSKLVYKFCAQCTYVTADSVLQKKLHLSGLRAIQSITNSDTFLVNPRAPEYVSKIIPALLSNLHEEKRIRSNSSTAQPAPSASQAKHRGEGHTPTPHMRKHSITDGLITNPLLHHSALESLSTLLSKTNAQNLRFVIAPVWAYMDKQGEWGQRAHVVFLVDAIVNAVAPQHRYVVMGSLLEKLGSLPTGSVKDRVGIVVALTVFVAGVGDVAAANEGSNVGGAGIAVVELLEALVGHLVEIAGAAEQSSSGTGPESEAKQFYEALIEAIGALAIHVAYPTQLSDIISFIVNRLERMCSGANKGDGLAVKKALLRCLVRIVAVRRSCLSPLESLATRKEIEEVAEDAEADSSFVLESFTSLSRNAASHMRNSRSKRASLTFPAKISPILLIPTLELLLDASQDVRILEAQFVHSALALEVVQQQIFGGQAVVASEDIEFLDVLYLKLHALSLGTGVTNGPVDYVAVGCIVSNAVQRFGSSAEGIGRSLQFLLKAQADAESQSNAKPIVRFAVTCLIRDHLQELANVYQISTLQAYLQTQNPAPQTEPVLIPTTNRVDILQASVAHYVLQKRVENMKLVAARTFNESIQIPSSVGIPRDVVVPMLLAGLAGKSTEIRETLDTEFSTNLKDGSRRGSKPAGGVVGGMGGIARPRSFKQFSIMQTGKIGSVEGNGPASQSLGSDLLKPGTSSSASVRSGVDLGGGSVSTRPDTPVKFEDLKDAISVHSTADATGKGSNSIRSVTPSARQGKLDVKNFLTNISSTISKSNLGGKHFQEPGTGKLPNMQMTSRDRKGPNVVSHDEAASSVGAASEVSDAGK